jgi:crotonobetainyl-CoA:carnitine CoA-transferase CaiB-like acyl-CoA transferase
MTGALDGLIVLDLTQGIAGPFGTKHLADYSATVIKIEKPTGDVARRAPPFHKDKPHPEKGGLFLYLNTNKRGVTLNLKSATGVALFKALARKADLVVESYRPGTMERLGLSHGALLKENPRLSMVSLSDFGQTGPYRDYRLTELVAFGLTGPMFALGAPGKEPQKFAENSTLAITGLAVGNAAMAAAITSQRTGRGAYFDLSIAESFLATTEAQMMSHFYSSAVAQRMGTAIRPQFLIGSYPCKDGYVAIQGVGRGESWWPRVFQMMGQPELSNDPRFKDSQAIMEHGDAFDAIWYTWLMEHTRKEIFDAAGEARFPIAPVYSSKDIYKDPHFNARRFFAAINHPHTGPVIYPTQPFRLHGTPCAEPRPAPTLGQHNEEIYGGMLGLSAQKLKSLRREGVI